MTTAQLITRFQERTGIASDLDPINADNDTEIVVWLNEAMREIARNVGLWKPSVTISTSTFPINLNSFNILDVTAVEFNGSILKQDIPAENEFWGSTTGSPARWTQVANMLYFDVTPTAGTYTIKIAGQILPTALNVATPNAEPELPLTLHEAIADLAVVLSTQTSITEPHQRQAVARLKASVYDEIRKVKRQITGGRIQNFTPSQDFKRKVIY